MKTFTATQLNKKPQEVFAAAKEDGTVLIEHDRYQGVFAIVWNKEYSEDEVLGHMLPEIGDKIIRTDGYQYECVMVSSDPAPDQ